MYGKTISNFIEYLGGRDESIGNVSKAQIENFRKL